MLKLDFLVFGLPRSMTTWAANWLTTDNTICWHDPAAVMPPWQCDQRSSSKRYRGMSCTGSWLFTDWVNEHPAPTLVIERPVEEVNASLQRLGLEPLADELLERFSWLPGVRVSCKDLLDGAVARDVWNYLLPDVPYDVERHMQLRDMVVLTDVSSIPTAADVERLRHMLREAYGSNPEQPS